MSRSSEYADRYAEAAMEQMRRYGIPASVTLAQGILESASGQSELSQKGNNHFGIKASLSWLESGGQYLVYSDDKPNEKFCQYASVEDSYEHHSLFLKGNKRYADLFELPPDDYVAWTKGLQEDGYATSKSYASSLQAVIRSNGLDRYDRMVLEEQGWKQTEGHTTTLELAARSGKEEAGKQEETPALAPAETQESHQEQPARDDRDFFNTIQQFAGGEGSWSQLLGPLSSTTSMDPIVEIASTLFAGLMAMAMEIDGMENAVQEEQQTQLPDVTAMASRNFEKITNNESNTVKRTRS